MKQQFLFLFFAILLTSCNSLAGNTEVTSPSISTPEITENPKQTPFSGVEPTWKKYTNEQVGFTIQYPSSWQEEDLPDENQGQMHHIVLKGPEGGVELIWGTGLGGACPEGYQPMAVAKGNWPACHTQKEDGTDLWSLAGQTVGETGFSGLAYTNDTTAKSREVVLQVISTLSFPEQLFSSDQLGLCFSYPRGYAQSPVKDAVSISSLVFPGTEGEGLFWLEISDSYNRTAEVIAYQSMTLAPPDMDIGHWTITIGGEQAVVLDGMPGQGLQRELQRRVYIVHQQTLYTLGFWPVRSENKAANEQTEALYAAVTSSWEWSPCSADVFTSTPQGLESTPAQTSVNDTMEVFSNDQLGLCFSYPREYTQNPAMDLVSITAPDLPGSDVKGRFWLEISNSDNRPAEFFADHEAWFAPPGMVFGRWTVMLGGEQAVVLDGMPGQELQRRVFIVRQQILYMLGFWPVRSKNKAANDQMEVLYDAVTSSWTWSPCSARE